MMNYAKKRPSMGSGYEAEMKRQRPAYGYESSMGYGSSSLNGQNSSSYGSAMYGSSFDYGNKSMNGSGGGYGGNISTSGGSLSDKTGGYSSSAVKSLGYGSSGGGGFSGSGGGFSGSAAGYSGSGYGTSYTYQDEDFTEDVDYSETEQIPSFGAGKPKSKMNTAAASRFANRMQMCAYDDEMYDEGYGYEDGQEGWGAPSLGNQGRGRAQRGRAAMSKDYQFMEGMGSNRGMGSQQMASPFQGSGRGMAGNQQMQQGEFQFSARGRGRGRGRGVKNMQLGFQGSDGYGSQEQFGFGAQEPFEFGGGEQFGFGAQQQSRGFRAQQQKGFGKQQQNMGFGGLQQNRGFGPQQWGKGGMGPGGNKMNSNVDPSQMPISHKLSHFLQVLKTIQRPNSIQTIGDAVTASRTKLSIDYEVGEMGSRVQGRSIYTGSLRLGNVFIYRSVGLKKKDLKHEVFAGSYDILTQKKPSDLMGQKDVAMEAMQIDLMSSLQQGKSLEDILQRLKDLGDVANSTNPSQGFNLLKKYLQNHSIGTQNSVAFLEQALSASKCKLARRFDCEPIALADFPRGRSLFRGIFFVNNIPIAVGRGQGKKEAKRECYSAALSNICKKSLIALMKDVADEIKMDEAPSVEHVKIENTKPADQRFTELITMVKSTSHDDQYITNLDKILSEVGMSAKCIFRLSSEELIITCTLCIDDVVIASGESTKKRESQIEAYKNAWELLETTSASAILNENEKLESGKRKTPGHSKGQAKTIQSNLGMLKKQGIDHTETWRVLEAMVILESVDSTDRVASAFTILSYSAFRNGMLLEWKWEVEADKFRCTITLQNQQVGEALGSSKKTSRNIASAKALFKLYATCDVLRTHAHRDQDPNRWIRYEEKKKEAETLKSSGFKVEVKQEDADFDAESMDTSEQKADPYLLHIYKEIINKYAEEETLDVLIFDPATPRPVSKELQTLVQKSDKVRSERRFYEGFPYMVILRQYTPQKLAELLRMGATTGPYPRVSLVDKSQLPDEEELEELIKKTEEEQAAQIASRQVKSENQTPRGRGGRGRRGRGRGRAAGSDALGKAKEVFEQML